MNQNRYVNKKHRTSQRGSSSKKHLLLAAVCSFFVLAYFLLGTGPDASEEEKELSADYRPEEVSDGIIPKWVDLNAYIPAMDQRPWESSTPNLEKTVTVSSGDTLMGLLVREGLSRTEAHDIISALQKVFNPRRLQQNQELVLAFENADDHAPKFQSMNLKLDVTREVLVTRCPENGFTSQELRHELESRPVRAEAPINSSLYNAAMDSGMPMDVLMQVIRAYSFDVDFQRDIRAGDRIEVLFEERLDSEGNVVRGGTLLYAGLNTRGRDLPIYRYEATDGETDFFNARGKSVRKTLMVTPIDGARLSSGYGMRRHPILGYSRMHPGLDFAAPTGTPIMAAGDGVVEYAGRKGNYGNYIRLRHPNEYHTVYAHMSRFASGIRSGARVTQGQIIGYVGSTGLSTGPHLHYEVHHRGSHVNPSTVDTPPGRTLEGQELELFLQARDELEILFASLEPRDKEKMARLY